MLERGGQKRLWLSQQRQVSKGKRREPGSCIPRGTAGKLMDGARHNTLGSRSEKDTRSLVCGPLCYSAGSGQSPFNPQPVRGRWGGSVQAVWGCEGPEEEDMNGGKGQIDFQE